MLACGDVCLEGSRTVPRTWKPMRVRWGLFVWNLAYLTSLGKFKREKVSNASRCAACRVLVEIIPCDALDAMR